ncbi:hypothetical protein C2845_PM04G15630 [Panicum miliaceum]|uniref:Uncharacterized protein n=1 Tax=Panicum miliaceum TaxID=4540 RepID=A0A3L6QVH9_PANMI|nr:hypothetical protein C2845_PM04G15630 [Panicum miliaceum]
MAERVWESLPCQQKAPVFSLPSLATLIGLEQQRLYDKDSLKRCVRGGTEGFTRTRGGAAAADFRLWSCPVAAKPLPRTVLIGGPLPEVAEGQPPLPNAYIPPPSLTAALPSSTAQGRQLDHLRISTKREQDKQERKVVGYRCSPHCNPEIVGSLSKDQKGFVEKIGFGSILSMAKCELPKGLTLWLLDRVDCTKGTLEVGGQSILIKPLVKMVTGAPRGNCPVVLSKPADYEFESKFTENGRGVSVNLAVSEMIKETDEVEFCRWFMLVIREFL